MARANIMSGTLQRGDNLGQIHVYAQTSAVTKGRFVY